MKNKVVVIFVALFLFFIVLLVGCAETTTLNVNMEGEVTTQSGKFVTISYYPIELSYDTLTKIVYIRNYTRYGNYVYTPYYVPNGLPYRYNSETNTLEEIEE